MKVTRSTGTHVAGWHGPRPGGGITGITQELDKGVELAADLLRNQFKCDVEIRFNSHRESGGAWINDGGEKCTVGIRAMIRTRKHTAKFGAGKPLGGIQFCPYLKPEVMKDGVRFSMHCGSVHTPEFKTAEECMNWIAKMTESYKISRILRDAARAA